MDDRTEQFERYRPLLLGLAYRLTASMWDAEDVIQDAYLRWAGSDRSDIRESRAFLITIVTRLALDQLRSARVTRESYTGPWLPEPAATDDVGPLDNAVLRDTLSYATVHLLQQLSPPERAVFLLREAFELPYEDIAATLATTAANCRQLHHRARKRMAQGPARFRPSRQEHEQLLTRFLDAARSGDLVELTSLLSEDVVAYNDGGGKVRAALRPIHGRENVLAFVSGLVRRYAMGTPHLIDANGEPALLADIGGLRQYVAIDVRDGRIHAIFAVLNPDKLARLGPAKPRSG